MWVLNKNKCVEYCWFCYWFMILPLLFAYIPPSSVQRTCPRAFIGEWKQIKGGSAKGLWNKLEEFGLYLHGLTGRDLKLFNDKNIMSSGMRHYQFCQSVQSAHIRHFISHSHRYNIKFIVTSLQCGVASQIAKFTGPTWGPTGSSWSQMGPMLAPWTLLSGLSCALPCVFLLYDKRTCL